MSKKRPLNFQAPSFTEAGPPPPMFEQGQSLGAPPVPTAAPEEPRQDEAPLLAPPSRLGSQPQRRVQTPPRKAEPAAQHIYLLALVATVLWAGGLTAYTIGLRERVGPFEAEPFAIAILAILGLAPVGLIWVGAYALRQGARLMAEMRRLETLSNDMIVPAAMSAAEVGSAVQAIRKEIQSAVTAADRARADLMHLKDLLVLEGDRLIEMAGGSARTASNLVQDLGRERQEFGLLQGKLDTRIGEINESIGRHAKMVAEASDLAQTQIQEAEAALAARAADLAAAAGEAVEAAKMAGDDLTRQAARIEQAGSTVGEQVQVVEEQLSHQRAALVSLAHSMRAEQEDLAVHFESHKAQIVEILRHSEQGSLQISEVAQLAGETLRQTISATAEQLRELSDQAQVERDLLGGSALQSFGALSEAAAFERRALEDETRRAIEELAAASEEAHKSAEKAADSARERVEALSNAAVVVGAKAEADFEQRLAQAKAMIEKTASLVEEAGLQSAFRLEQTVGKAFGALDSLQQTLGEIEQRAQSLPNEAVQRGHEVRKAIENANQALIASARNAAHELEEIDGAFQERVKRNYEMLSEAVRLMGVLGGNAATRAAAPTPPRPAPAAAPPLPLKPRAERPAQPAPPAEDDLTLRPRLKLTPAAEAAEEEEDEDAGLLPPETDSDLSWSELVAALDENDADDVELERALIAQIDALGIDAQALIPRRRLDEVARLYEGGDAAGAREAIHRLAPAAVRKLSRRILSDKLLRAQAERLIDRYTELLGGVARRGGEGLTAVGLLGSDSGRAFLLLDAALADIG
ncbi:MAG: polar localization protein TipN [Caulobacteraceae bacterium]